MSTRLTFDRLDRAIKKDGEITRNELARVIDDLVKASPYGIASIRSSNLVSRNQIEYLKTRLGKNAGVNDSDLEYVPTIRETTEGEVRMYGPASAMDRDSYIDALYTGMKGNAAKLDRKRFNEWMKQSFA